MRWRKGGGTPAPQVVVLVLAVLVNVVTGSPTSTAPPRHTINHVADHYLDDALGDWLDNFGSYTFMIQQDLDPRAGGEGEEEKSEEKEEENEGELSAPIAVSTGSRSLLDPRRDYLVTLESLVAEEGSIFITLSKYENQTKCGVGGLTVEEEEEDKDENRHQHSQHRVPLHPFNLQEEGNSSSSPSSSSSSSRWVDTSKQFWWASGQLAGGGLLSITFTPPECGCLSLSTYFSLPVGNVRLVVGPQAYPEELQTLLCIDPITSLKEDTVVDEEEDEEEEEDVIEYLRPSPLVSKRTDADDKNETEAETNSEQVTEASRKMTKEEKKQEKKNRRQMKRERIRQAGRRQARRQNQEGEGKRPARKWNRKRNQRRKRVWQRRRPGRRFHHNQTYHEDEDYVNGTAADHHHHSPFSLNASAGVKQEETLVDILLQDLDFGNTTLEEEETRVNEEEEEEEVEGLEEEDQSLTPRQKRKNRRQRKKMMRKQRRKAYPAGVKFCCKQGIKHKKNFLQVDAEEEGAANSSSSCTLSLQVVETFASHQFGLEEDTCSKAFVTCCERFTSDMWDRIKARKKARRTERKQMRKQRRQDRKQKRRKGRTHRGRRRKVNSQLHHMTPDCQGDDCTT